MPPNKKAMRTLLALVLMAWAAQGTHALADAVRASDIYVVDGDTIEFQGKRIRLIDFDAPELGHHAHCGIERMLAARAMSRLRQMITIGRDLDLQLVQCSCHSGTEGTTACNWGRACGHLTVDGHDVGDTLISEKLAHSYICGRYSCPRRLSWCPFGNMGWWRRG
jgi:endonuclease YncB( thermonuclease family)